MKKITALFLAAVMLFSLAACGNETQAAQSETTGTNAEANLTETVSEDSAENTITGTVSSVGENSITLTTEDGTEKTITVTDSTEYTAGMPSGGTQQGEPPSDMPQGGNSNGQDGGTPPEMPQGGAGNDRDGSTPPEMPQGGAGNGQDGSTPPEMPSDAGSGAPSDNNAPSGGTSPADNNTPSDGNALSMPNGDAMQPGLDMLTEGTEIMVTLAEDGSAAKVQITMNGGFGGENPGGDMGGGPGGSMGGGNASISYTAVNTYSEDTSLSSQSVSSTGTDENAILVTDGTTSLNDLTIDRSSSDSTGGDNSSFYGVGAAVLTTGGTLNVSGSTITTNAAGGAGVFAYGDGTAYVSDSTITTQQDTSGGIHVAGGGTLYAWDLNVETNGESSAAIRSDRGSGTMVVDGGSYTSNGIGSPAIYSTADISVANADLTANGSEAICIEGKNSIRLYDCSLSGNMSDDSRNDSTWNVILYQSMSGDSAEGNSVFEMDGGTLTANNGGMFYTTNTESTFILSNVDIQNAADSEFFLKCTGNSNQRGWGTAGANGARCSFSAIRQTMEGNVIWDSISTLNFTMTDGSILTGAFLQDESNAGNGGDGYATLNLGEGCTWIVTKNSTLTNLTLSGQIVDANGQSVSVIGSDGTVYISGTSDLTVTVESFLATADVSGCATVSSFSDYSVQKPV